MGFLDMRQWMAQLEQHGELRRIKAEVDWDREIGAVTRRMLEKKGPALLFENIKGYKDGRCTQLIPTGADLAAGNYRLIFDTGSYYAMHQIDALHPVVEVMIVAREGESTFHIPLLLSPNGYTTYRGS